MYCHYCLQPIVDHSKRCSECGSRLTETDDSSSGQSSFGDLLPGTQAIALAAVIVILVPLIVCGTISLLRPGALDGLFRQAAPAAAPVPQVTRAAFATPTPLAWQEHRNQQAGFTISFPAGWLVINQARPGWQEEVRAEAEQYGWAESLFETGVTPPGPRTRAVDPAAIDIQGAKIVVFNVGLASALDDNLALSDIERIAANNAPALLALAGPQSNATYSNQRNERLMINGQEALLIEYTSESEILTQRMRGRVRLYFIPAGSEMYVIGYLAEEQLANADRAIYDQIVQSFQVE